MIEQLKEQWTLIINEAVSKYAKEKGLDDIQKIQGEVPPKRELGDLAFPLFSLAKPLRMAPPLIASEIKERLNKDNVKVVGAYLNVFFDKKEIFKGVIKDTASKTWGTNDSLKGEKIMVEFSSPNTNKPLHLGHMRNDALGESVSALLKESGAEVMKVDLVNDRGVHICASMLAYDMFSNGDTPEKSGIKSDHFVGDYYVKYNDWLSKNPDKDKEVHKLLQKWEEGDKKTHELWNLMRKWALDGIKETYKRTGVAFDKFYFESELYKKGKDEVLKGLEKGVFYKAEDGAVKVSLEPIGLDEKVLLRSDGTSIYMTQDIGTAIARHNDWPYTSCIYVVGNEQIYHFKALFYVLSLLGFEWSKKLYHLSYGMVNLPTGRMKSREGTVVDADDLLDKLHAMSLESIKKDRGLDAKKADEIAEKVALGALNYFLLQMTPQRDMIFNPEESLSFSGNTGPYLQYMGARVSAILRQAGKFPRAIKSDIVLTDSEEALISLIDEYPSVVKKSAETHDPSLVCSHLYQSATVFSKWYHDESILKAEPNLRTIRLNICVAFKTMMEKAFRLLNIPFLEEM